MIDIAQLEKLTFDIKLRDGRIINVRQPNKDLFNDTFKMIKLIEANGEDEKILDIIYKFLFRIINRNTNDIKLTLEEIELEMDLVVAMIIVRSYQKWFVEAMEDINF